MALAGGQHSGGCKHTAPGRGLRGQDHLPQGAVPGRTDFGNAGYGGAAPSPEETHRYQFTVHALDVEHLEVDKNASGAMIGFNVHFHALGSASLTVTYR